MSTPCINSKTSRLEGELKKGFEEEKGRGKYIGKNEISLVTTKNTTIKLDRAKTTDKKHKTNIKQPLLILVSISVDGGHGGERGGGGMTPGGGFGPPQPFSFGSTRLLLFQNSRRFHIHRITQGLAALGNVQLYTNGMHFTVEDVIIMLV